MRMMLIPLCLTLLGGTCCTQPPPTVMQPLALDTVDLSPTFWLTSAQGADQLTRAQLLEESWAAYRQRFIQADGRVIDWESGGRTVSEGQAYAMLRAVLANDPKTFALTLGWAEDNLRRPSLANDADGVDHLWAWQWGKATDGRWGILDGNFASDADIDAITALILAARRWQRRDYLDLAQLKLADLWVQSTLAIPLSPEQSSIYLLPGPLSAFQPQPGMVYLNPSYLAPYAFRLFAQVDPSHDWLALVDSSYRVLDQVPTLSPKGLPGDWVRLDMASQTLAIAPEGAKLQSHYGFDAYRVWWRIAWDAAWFQEERAKTFLGENLAFLAQTWQQEQRLPAKFDLAGTPLVDYEATAQYAMLYPAFQQVNATTATALYEQTLIPAYRNGIWDNANAYYVQNMAWLGLFPPEALPSGLLQGSTPAISSGASPP